MARQARLGEYLLAVEGLAIGRHLFDADDTFIDERVAEVAELVDGMRSGSYTDTLPTPDTGVRDGYAAWAPTYDDTEQPVWSLERDAVQDMLADLPAGRVLDAGCGTLRHGGWLARAGHHVVGVDISEGMLRRARTPRAIMVQGDVCRLPLRSGSFDAAVSGLVVAHLPELSACMRELARVVRPGGHIVVSDVHPVAGLLGATVSFKAAGARHSIRTHVHLHSEFLQAFREAGLSVLGCVEPVYGPGETEQIALATHARAAARAAYAGVPAVVVWHVRNDGTA